MLGRSRTGFHLLAAAGSSMAVSRRTRLFSFPSTHPKPTPDQPLLPRTRRSLSSSSSPPTNSKPRLTLVGGQVVPFERRRPSPSEPERLTCNSCGFVYYENPKVVTGSVASYQSKDGEELILLCRRAIPPRTSFWNLCAGYMEVGETMQESAAREAKEEAFARLGGLRLLSLYDIKHIGQVHVYYSAQLLSDDVAPGEESLEVRLFRWEDLPWDELAFPTVSWALMHHGQAKAAAAGQVITLPFGNPVLEGFPKSTTNLWYRPDRGLYYDDTWLKKKQA